MIAQIDRISKLRTSMGWDRTVVYADDPRTGVPDEAASTEDVEDVKEARRRLADPNETTMTLEELRRELDL